MRRMMGLLCLTWVACGSPTELASTPKASAKPAIQAEPFPAVDLAELQTLIAQGNVTLLDANGSALYKAGHLPKALDFEGAGDALASSLPADKNANVVAYCGGPQCIAWEEAANAAAKLGYTNVRHFAGGVQGWKAAQLPLEM
jgi:rhodanese-related sulfurtransferase